MGMFDTFKVDDCDGQVKMYDCTMDTYCLDDTLPCNASDDEDYGIKLRYGGWVVVKNNVFFKYQKDKPCLTHCYDKWGHPWDDENPRYD